MRIAILLAGDHTRRILKRALRRNPSAVDLERFCRVCLAPGERLVRSYYYDCPPFSEVKRLPVFRIEKDFSADPVSVMALQFQRELEARKFFKFRKGRLSFEGWRITEECQRTLLEESRILTDDDFRPVFTQKQVDMKIGLDLANLATKRVVDRILCTADSDFVPAIHFARENDTPVALLSDGVGWIKRDLLRACSDHRIVDF